MHPTTPSPAPAPRGVALLFPGQGAQQPLMAVGLYHGHPPFRRLVDEVFEVWGAEGAALRADWLSGSPAANPDGVSRAQPLLFAVDWALGRMVLDWGVRPAALLGHSVGEVAAATLAGVFTLEEAAGLMADRVAHIESAPAGGMLAVQATAAEMTPYLHDDVVVGAVNAPRQVVLAGSEAPLAVSEARLRAAGFTCRRTRALSPFHSPALAPAALAALPALSRLPLRAPGLPLHSAYTPGPLTPAQAADPRFWAGQPAAPVLFGPALDALLGTGELLLLEAGPGQGLTALAKRHPAVGAGGSAAQGLLPARARGDATDLRTLRTAVERLLAGGWLAHDPLPAPAGTVRTRPSTQPEAHQPASRQDCERDRPGPVTGPRRL
ncbi:acyltransferase domain-containing protein [Streptomyces pilosus]|uniref:acyltransferase domain-containing protein n=1 Tax=Streptomyces pilosus TaxID=28893 RepID=UPI001E414368|nr:acyltransferase domain-containing protein [Streptomyces pilosus]